MPIAQPDGGGNGATLAYRVNALEKQAAAHENTARPALKMLAEHEEQINGKRGIQAAIDELRDEVRSLRRATWTVGGTVVLAALLQQYLPT